MALAIRNSQIFPTNQCLRLHITPLLEGEYTEKSNGLELGVWAGRKCEMLSAEIVLARPKVPGENGYFSLLIARRSDWRRSMGVAGFREVNNWLIYA